LILPASTVRRSVDLIDSPPNHQNQEPVGRSAKMAKAPITRIIVPSLALVAVGSATLALGITQIRREPPAEADAVAAAIPPSAPRAQDRVAVAITTARAEATSVVAALAAPPVAPESAGKGVLAFDVARIEPSGDAVIAGRAAPGASVELLRDGAVHDRVVADQSGQFVIVPPRLPAGDYKLTLRSREPDGAQLTSKQSVAITLVPDLKVRPVMMVTTPDRATAAPSKPTAPTPVGSPAAEGSGEAVKPPDVTGSVAPRATAVGGASGGHPPAAAGSSKPTSMMVSRGDSLWRISRTAYGTGMRYPAILDANHAQIRNANRIYPGQVFVLPDKAH
jgi:nucleoid-associated protein YgaU